MSIKPTSLAAYLLIAATPTAALAFNVDSDLNDWIHEPIGSNSDWSNVLDTDIVFAFEDQTGGAGAYLSPGWGGQPYDAEAIYVRRTTTSIDIAVVTGRAPGADGYAAGDIAIDFGLDGSFDYGVVTLTDSTGIGSAGQLYRVSGWDYGLWEDPADTGPAMTPFKLAHPTTVAAGTLVDTVDLTYSAMKYNGTTGLPIGQYGDANKHYVIETSIDITSIDPTLSSEAFLVHWTMACANDIVEIAQATIPPPPPVTGVPSPAPLALLLAGLASLFARRLVRRS